MTKDVNEAKMEQVPFLFVPADDISCLQVISKAIELGKEIGAPGQHVEMLEEKYSEVLKWRRNNIDKVKIPR